MTTPLWKRVIGRILQAILALIFIAPLIWVIVSSFSPQPGSAQTDGWGINNYVTLFNYQAGLPVYLFNSVVISLITIVLSVVVCTMAGYSFSRFQYPGRNLGFMVTLSILMVPYASLLIPLMVWYSQIGLNNTLVGIGLVMGRFRLMSELGGTLKVVNTPLHIAKVMRLAGMERLNVLEKENGR